MGSLSFHSFDKIRISIVLFDRWIASFVQLQQRAAHCRQHSFLASHGAPGDVCDQKQRENEFGPTLILASSTM